MSEIIKHAEFEDVYDDASHPIPSLRSVDVQVTKKGGGADLILVIADPLYSDERSQRRLLDKLETYLRFLLTPEFMKDAGIPTPENTFIVVRINPKSDSVIFDLLERSRDWVRQNNATLRVVLLQEA